LVLSTNFALRLLITQGNWTQKAHAFLD